MQTSARGKATGVRIAPATPKVAGLRAADLRTDGFEDEKHLRGIEYVGLDMSDGDVAAVDVEQCRFDNVEMPAALRRVTISDTEFTACDLANLQADEGSLLQSAISASRLTGLSWSGGAWRDVTVDSSRANLASFRYAKLRMVIFRDCAMAQADFQRVKLHNVLFEKCDLSGAQFSGAELVNVRFVDCVLVNLRGVTDLKGATVQGGDLLGLAASLAREAGIAVEW